MVACKTDRLAWSTADFLGIVFRLETKGVGLIILSVGGQCLDTRLPTGTLMMTMLAAVAEFERAQMLERQRDAIVEAKREGRYKRRVPTARNRFTEVLRLRADGKTPTQVAKLLRMSRMSVYRIIRSDAVAEQMTA